MSSNTVLALISVDRSPGEEVVSHDGKRIDVSGVEWRLAPEATINWGSMPPLGVQVRHAMREYLKHSIRSVAPHTAESRFKNLKTFLGAATDLDQDLSTAENFSVGLLKRVRSCLAKRHAVATVVGALHAFRYWYVWAADVDLPGFDFEVATGLENLTIGGAPKGEAVLRNDPKRGPLHSTEFDRLYQAMRKATETDGLSEVDLAATWLFMALGCNPRNLQLLNEEDLIQTRMADGTTKYELRVPRIKKLGVKERSQFRTRPLRQEIGELLRRIVSRNRTARALLQGFLPGGDLSTPLFRSEVQRESLMGTAFEGDAFRCRTAYFGEALARVSSSLNLTGRDGEPLHLTARRLRYTFATRLVQEGASPVMLADALDHTDLQHVMVYYNARSDIVTKLDKTIAMQLAPWAQAFMGKIVSKESDAERGDDPASRVRHLDRHHSTLESVGSCGRHGPCGLAAPIACYTCVRFQPWLDAPHEVVLDALLEDRNQHLQRGADPKMTQARDLTITAVASVVQQCRQLREEGDNDA
ncbi:site-specific integrase [Cupriavidus campinensis]